MTTEAHRKGTQTIPETEIAVDFLGIDGRRDEGWTAVCFYFKSQKYW